MRKSLFLLVGLMALPLVVHAAGPQQVPNQAQVQSMRLTEADRKVTVGRILLKWGGYVEKVNGQNRRAWAAAMWPSLANADLDNLQKASRAVTYEGMRNAVLGQRPQDDQIIDRMARQPKSSGVTTKALGSLVSDLVFTPITPCRVVDTRVPNDRIGAGATRNLDVSNPGGNFTSQGGSATDCGIPANPAALALSVTGLGNLGTGYLRVFPFSGTNAQGSPVPLNTVNTTVTNDMIVPTTQGVTQELKVFSTATTHYAAFVTGYFMAPEATAPECTYAYEDVTVAAASSNYGFVTCPAGYAATGGGCTNYGNGLLTSRNEPGVGNQAQWFCEFTNPTAGQTGGRAFARCCRSPGRAPILF